MVMVPSPLSVMVWSWLLTENTLVKVPPVASVGGDTGPRHVLVEVGELPGAALDAGDVALDRDRVLGRDAVAVAQRGWGRPDEP